MSLAADSIYPKHGDRLTIFNATMSSHAAWATSSSTAVVGPIGATSLAPLVISWYTTQGFATISIPEFTFTGANTYLSFGVFAGMPTPVVAQHGLIEIHTNDGTVVQSFMDMLADGSISFAVGTGGNHTSFPDTAVIVLKPFVYRYPI